MKNFLKNFILYIVVFITICNLCTANELTDDYFDIAQNYFKEGNKSKAIEYIDRILEIEKDYIPAIGLKIKLTPPVTSSPLPDPDKPLIFDVPYVPTSNPQSDIYYKQGLEHYKNKNYEAAENKLKFALQANNCNYRAYNTLGLVCWAQNKHDEARKAFEKANELNKTFTIPLNNLAQMYRQLGSSEKSYAVLLTAQNLNPSDFCSYLLLGDYYRDIHDYDNAIKYYREVVKINPKYNLVYLKIARAKTGNLDYTGSNETLNYYHGINPNDDFLYYLMTKNYIYLNQLDKAKESIYKAILINNCVEYRIELGKINYQTEDVQDALDDFTSTLNFNVSPEIYNYIGMCYYNLHDFNKAIVNINKAASMPNSRILYSYNLAKIYYTLKDNVNFTKYMDTVKNFQPATCQDFVDMSGILLEAASKNAAICMINKGISKYPKVRELYLKKMKIYDLTNDTQGVEQTKSEIESIFGK